MLSFGENIKNSEHKFQAILFTFSLEIAEYSEDLFHEYDEDVGLYEDEDDENGEDINISWF